ncbi:MAG: ABC transporter permease subunit [Zavarzinella sp.]
MNLPIALRTIRWMIIDTIRQSLATKVFWAMVLFSALVMVFCLGVELSGKQQSDDSQYVLPPDDPELKKLSPEKVKEDGVDILGQDKLSLGFGLFQLNTARGADDSFRFLLTWLSGLIAGTLGVFLAIIWTSGLLPTFLEPSQITVLLAKPIPRWSFLLGKVVGVMVLITFHVSFFVVGTWLTLGLATGRFDATYFLVIPILVIHFFAFYGFSVMLAVWSRSTVVCVFGTLLFWTVAWGINYARHAIQVHQPPGMTATSNFMLETSYWILPKPADLNIVFEKTLDSRGISAEVPEFEQALAQKKIRLEWSVFTSFLFSIAMLGISCYEFRKTEY